MLVEEGPRYVRELIEWGARFDRDADGRPALGREAAHSVRRVLHAGDATGREIGRVLWERVAALPSVETIDHALVTELIVERRRRRRRRGSSTPTDSAHEVRAPATLLATGGAGQVFRETTNPGGGDRRRHRARVSRRRPRRRSGVRAVSSDRAEPAPARRGS